MNTREQETRRDDRVVREIEANPVVARLTEEDGAWTLRTPIRGAIGTHLLDAAQPKVLPFASNPNGYLDEKEQWSVATMFRST